MDRANRAESSRSAILFKSDNFVTSCFFFFVFFFLFFVLHTKSLPGKGIYSKMKEFAPKGASSFLLE